MRTALVLLAFVLPATSSSGAELVQHRGIWMHPKQFSTPELADAWIAKIAAARLNAIYPLVWYHGGTAWFKSQSCPMDKDVPEGFDPLGHLVKIAHAHGIDVHPWFVNGSYGAPVTKGLFVEHPEWRLQGGRGDRPWYDLGRPEVRDFQRDLMLECLKNYDVDGLHFDYIRYSNRGPCYCRHCQEEFARKYGFQPQRAGDRRFPVFEHVGSNPLAKPTTAEVLAVFHHGGPAITLNRLGRGEAALMNWQAMQSASGAIENFVQDTLTRYGADKNPVFQLNTTQTAAKYRAETQSRAGAWLRELGFRAKRIDENALAKVPPNAVLVLYGQYYIPDEATAWLENFVRGGGHCLLIDGPVFAIKQPALQHVLGMKATGKYFHGPTVISPTPEQKVLEVGPALDVERELQRAAKWAEYRTETVTELVRAVYRGAKAMKPQAQISAAVFYKKESADAVCQDWYGWLREGCIDYVLPMAYTEDNDTLAEAFDEWKQADPTMERILPGLSIYSRKQGTAVPRNLDLIRSQLQMCRTYQTHGNQFFSLAYLTDPLIEELADKQYKVPARPWYPPKRSGDR